MGLRIGLFIATNLAIVVLFSAIIAVVSYFTGVDISWYGGWYLVIFIFALILGFTGSIISLFISKWVAKKTYQIQTWEEEALSTMNPKEVLVYNTVKQLANDYDIISPEIGIYEDSEPNAFATGSSKNNSLVAVSSGLLDVMTNDEIEWVIAHEMAHILNGDMLTMSLIQWVLNTFVIFASRVLANLAEKHFGGEESKGPWFIYYGVSIVLDILFGFLASLIAMRFSRYREYRADADSAYYVGKDKMIASLQRLKSMQDAMHTTSKEQMATFKIGSKKRSGILKYFSTHPDLDDRIKVLQAMDVTD